MQILTETARLKIEAVDRIEGKRLDIAELVDTRRMDLYINALKHSKNFNEKECKQLDDMLLDSSVFENKGVCAVSLIKAQKLHLSMTFSVNNTLPTIPMIDKRKLQHKEHDSTRSKINNEYRKLQSEQKCLHILTNTSQKVQSIEESEKARLEAVDCSDKRSVNLLNKVVSGGNFEPKFLTQIKQELTSMQTSLQSTTALQDVVNVQLVSDSSDKDEYL